MNAPKFLLQGLSETDDHFAAVRELLRLSGINRCLISVAFANLAGVDMLYDELSKVHDKIQLYIGIRNGITTKQAIQRLMELGIYPICVDTATQSYIFHPKVYVACNISNAKLIIGSANFTTGGLIKNVEASVLMSLDLSVSSDNQVVDSIFSSFEQLNAKYPNNVFQLTSATDLNQFVDEGLLIDETASNIYVTSHATSAKTPEQTPRMRLNTRKIGRRKVSKTHYKPAATTSLLSDTPVISTILNNNLIWKSKPLSERDLSIPTGSNTNPTGSILLNRGDPSQKFDFQHFFRNEVFVNAEWTFDVRPKYSHLERTYVKFQLIIKGIDYGIYTLELSHNTKVTATTAKQRNGLTSLHWGPALKIIKREDLLNGILYLYAPNPGSDIYKIDIDVDE